MYCNIKILRSKVPVTTHEWQFAQKILTIRSDNIPDKKGGSDVMCTQNELNVVASEVVAATVALLQDKIYKIILYGSYARGDFTNESDVDIMIILNCNKEEVTKYRRDISRVSSRIGLKNDVEVSLLLRDRETFEYSENKVPFYTNIQKEGITLYG
jgi:predicted nucleotidyltransferase